MVWKNCEKGTYLYTILASIEQELCKYTLSRDQRPAKQAMVRKHTNTGIQERLSQSAAYTPAFATAVCNTWLSNRHEIAANHQRLVARACDNRMHLGTTAAAAQLEDMDFWDDAGLDQVIQLLES